MSLQQEKESVVDLTALSTEDFLSYFKGNQIFVIKPEKPFLVSPDNSDLEMHNKPWHKHVDDIQECIDQLNRQNEPPYNKGIFFAVNEFDRSLDPPQKRTAKMLTKIRAVWADDDTTGEYRDDFPILPNIALKTSTIQKDGKDFHKFQYFWLTTTDDWNEWDAVMNTMVGQYDGDKQARDRARILRVPGFYHNKGEPQLVNAALISGKPYKWEDVVKAFPPTCAVLNVKQDASRPNNEFVLDDAKTEVINGGEDSHSAITRSALHFANKGLDAEIINEILSGWLALCTNKDDRWHRRKKELKHDIGTALNKVVGEIDVVIPLKKEKPKEIPLSPKLVYPESLAMIRENLGMPIKDQIDEFFNPFVSTFCSVILNGNVLTPLYNRVPTDLELTLGLSTAGKDLNSSVPLKVFSQQKWPREIEAYIKNLSNPPGGITSDTAIMQYLEGHDMTLLWLVTECSDNIKKMTRGGNTSMEAMQESIKYIYDGQKLSPTFKVQDTKSYGKNLKYDGNVKTIVYPNVSLAWYTQTKNFFPLISIDMLTGGFAGRFNYNMLSQKVKRKSVYDRSSGVVKNTMDKAFVEYITNCITKCKDNSKRVICSLDNDAEKVLLDFDNSLDRYDENLEVFIKRIAMSIEMELTVWAAHESILKDEAPRITKQMVKAILPKYEHQVVIREDFVFERVGEGLAEIRENGIEAVLTEMLTGGVPHILSYSKNLTAQGESRIKRMFKQGYVPKAAINQRLIKLPDLKLTTASAQNPAYRELDANGKIHIQKDGKAHFVRFI